MKNEFQRINRPQITVVYVATAMLASIAFGMAVVTAYAYIIQPWLQSTIGR